MANVTVLLPGKQGADGDFPVADIAEIEGAPWSVANAAALQTIPPKVRKVEMTVELQDTGDVVKITDIETMAYVLSPATLVRNSAKTSADQSFKKVRSTLRGTASPKAFGAVKTSTGQFPLTLNDDGSLDVEGAPARYVRGFVPMMTDQAGNVIMDSDGEDVVLHAQTPGLTRSFVVEGIHATEVVNGVDGMIVLAGRDPETLAQVDCADEFAPMVYAKTSLGRKNLFQSTPDPDTYSQTELQLTFNQLADVTPGKFLPGNRVRVAGGSSIYPVGAVSLRQRLKAGAGKVIVIAITGQSNSIGAKDAIDSGDDPADLLITALASRPGRVLCPVGGIMPLQVIQNSSSLSTEIDAAQYASLVDAKEGIQSWRASESMAMGLVETIASQYDDDAVFVVVSWGHGSSKLENVWGSSTAKAQPLLNFELILAKLIEEAADADDPGFEPIWGRTVEIGCCVINGHESNYVDPALNYEVSPNRLPNVRTRIDGWKTTTGQSSDIPLLLLQPGASANLTNEVNNSSIGSENYATANANTYVMPLYWSDVGDYATVHHPPLQHRRIGEACGWPIAHHIWGKRFEHLRIVSAVQSGATITLTFNMPMLDDPDYIASQIGAGYRYFDDNDDSYITPTGHTVAADGMSLTLTFGSTPAGVDPYIIAGNGVKDYGGGVYGGLGRTYGMRTQIRAVEPIGWSITTGEPFWNWQPNQKIAVT